MIPAPDPDRRPSGRPTPAAGPTGPSAAPIGPWARRRRLRELVAVARTLEPEGLVVGTVGNVSVRTGGTMWITPTRSGYAGMRPRHLVEVDLVTGRTLGRGGPSRELPLHLAVLRARPDVGAVLHTHSVAATAWSFLDEPLRPELEDLAYHGIAPVRTSPPAAVGSAELARVAAVTLGDDAAVLLGHHGVLTVGATPADALRTARVVERQARVAWLVRGAAPWATGVASAVLDDAADARA